VDAAVGGGRVADVWREGGEDGAEDEGYWVDC
jgi:hypothetical protein